MNRSPDYFWHLRRKYGLAVLPVAVFLRVGLNGLGERGCEISVFGEWVMKMRYWYVGFAGAGCGNVSEWRELARRVAVGTDEDPRRANA